LAKRLGVAVADDAAGAAEACGAAPKRLGVASAAAGFVAAPPNRFAGAAEVAG